MWASWSDLQSRFFNKKWLIDLIRGKMSEIPSFPPISALVPLSLSFIPHFGRKNSQVSYWMVSELFPLSCLTVWMFFFLITLLSISHQTSFIHQSTAAKQIPLEKTKPKATIQHQSGSQAKPKRGCLPVHNWTLFSESFTSHVQWWHSTYTSKLYLIENKFPEPHEMKLWGA